MFQEFIGVDFWTALFVLLNTLLVFFVAKKFLFKPVIKMVEDRQREIDDMYEKADKAKTDAQALQEEYTLRLAEAAETGERMVREAVARGQSREEEILRNANEKASAMMDKAAADIEREKKKALNDAKDQISVIAIDIAGKVVGRSIDSADQTRLVDSFIESLGDEV